MGSPAAPAARPRRPSSKLRRYYKRARRKLGQVLLPPLAPTILRVLARSWHLEERHREHLESAFRCTGRILVLWHGRMLLPLVHLRDRGFRVLVSPSDDGSLAVGALTAFGHGVIRGSSNRRPAHALREMLGELQQGGSIVLTPDGPRGPRHSMNVGAAWLSSATGFPIVAIGGACDRAWRLDSWDRFTIPKLGARVVLGYAEPIVVPSGASDTEIERATDEIGRRLVATEEEAFERLGTAPDW